MFNKKNDERERERERKKERGGTKKKDGKSFERRVNK